MLFLHDKDIIMTVRTSFCDKIFISFFKAFAYRIVFSCDILSWMLSYFFITREVVFVTYYLGVGDKAFCFTSQGEALFCMGQGCANAFLLLVRG